MYKRKTRKNSEIRKLTIEKDIMMNAFSSILISYGQTKVYCTISIETKVPAFVEDSMGWLTAEYNMLPAATEKRKSRPVLKQDGRSIEIQRLIGRVLRSALDLRKIRGYTLVIDCDVIQADGGTRTASITGSYCALALAVKKMMALKMIKYNPLIHQIASVSAGKVDQQIMVDLDYEEDKNAEVDFNVIMNSNREFIEIQGTAEKGVMTRQEFNTILDYSEVSIDKILSIQDEVIDS